MIRLKKFIIGLFLISLLFTSGCALLKGSKDKNSKKEEKQRTKIENVESLIGSNLKDKLDQLSSIHYGVDYALSKETEPSKNVEVAKDLNTRAMSLSGQPTVEEVKNMRQMIDDLTSKLANEIKRGKETLDIKDAAYTELQNKSKLLKDLKDAEIRKYMKIAADTAAIADSLQLELNKMDSWFGLGAVFYGLKKFIFSMAWVIGIGSIIYLILRFASMSNPIAASIFSIFDQIMSWFINLIKVLAPKALAVAGQTATAVANKYRDAMTKMIDNIEALKVQQKLDPTKKYTLDEFLNELSKSLNDDQKAMVDKIKRDIGY